MKTFVFIVGIILILPALSMLKERYKLIPTIRQKFAAWGIVGGVMVAFLLIYWLLLSIIGTNEYEWLISDICFVLWVYVSSYAINYYSVYCARNVIQRVLKDVENMINVHGRETCCPYCSTMKNKVELIWNNPTKQIETLDDFNKCVVVKGACCKDDEEEIKRIVQVSCAAYMADNGSVQS